MDWDFFHHWSIGPCGSDGKQHTAVYVYLYWWNHNPFVWFAGNTLAYIPNKHTNMSIHIRVLLIRPCMLAASGSCVCARCECVCVCVCTCVFWIGGGGLACWLPEAKALKCVKWGSSQRWALGYEVALRGVCVCVCVFVSECVTHAYQTYVKFTDTSADVSDAEPAGRLHPFPPPCIPPDVEQSSVWSVR